jgi:hypothetical protein
MSIDALDLICHNDSEDDDYELKDTIHTQNSKRKLHMIRHISNALATYIEISW